MKKALCLLALISLTAGPAFAGLDIVRSNGITLTGADGINYIGTSGITLTGADGLLAARSNGITLTGADGITLTGADGITLTGADGGTYTGPNGITLTGADGITLTGADGITLTGADGITLTGADGRQYRADSVILRQPNGITLTGADGITLTGADGITLTGADGAVRTGTNGITLTGADGITLTGADGITLTGADGITLTGADSAIGLGPDGVQFDLVNPSGITLTGADGITLTGAHGINLTNADNVVLRNIDGLNSDGTVATGLQSVDPELAIQINRATNDSNINAVIAYHHPVSETDINNLRQVGIQGGTRFRALPMVYVTGTKSQILAISRLSAVRSIYGNRTLTFSSDPYLNSTGVQRVAADSDLRGNNGLPISGRGVTVAVLDTGINSTHADLAGRVIQNVRLADTQSAPAGFLNPIPIENVSNTDPVAGHGTFVAGVVAASGGLSGGRYSGVAPGASLLGLSAGDANLTTVLSGLDYVLERGPVYNVRVVNCSFSANTVYDENDPVNLATKMLADRGVSVVFSAGNAGPGNGTLNPYAQAPWVISVGATDAGGTLAGFSSRGTFGGDIQRPTVVAPGVNIAGLRSSATTTSVGGLGGADSQRLTPAEMPFYTTASGTSFSAPQVAGGIALMLEANSALSPSDIKDILSRTATPLPRHFLHETGAGMLNTHAAALEAAYPARRMGVFRSTLSKNQIQFTTSISQTFTEMIVPGTVRSTSIPMLADVVQASVSISWGLSTNDFGLKLYDSNDALIGSSNGLNLPGLTGRQEKIVLRNPGSQPVRSAVRHTGGIGTAQNIYGLTEVTRVRYPVLFDLNSLSPELQEQVELSLRSNLMLPEGWRFRPGSTVTRFDLAAAFVRSGLAPQYMGAAPMFSDVRDNITRNAVESVQTNAARRLIYDAVEGGRFEPNRSATRLAAAIAFVRAADMESLAGSATLPVNVTDSAMIPAQWRGHVAIALQHGFVRLEGGHFNPNNQLTRMDLACALNAMIY